MDFGFTAEQEKFRQELRSFLQTELTPEFRKQVAEKYGERSHYSPEFSRRLAQKGWVGLAWPEEYGGRGLGYIERLIYDEEMALARAPISYHHAAERQFGPSIIMHGTEEQKREFLPRITRGEMSIAIGYSERNAGSDLAAVECAAVEEGDHFIVNGHKMWNSAHLAEWLWVSVRTDPGARKHRGISILLVDLSLPGIKISPIPLMDGSLKNEVTFTDVRVPRTCLVGEMNMGWYVLAANLDLERAGLEAVTAAWILLQRMIRHARDMGCDGRAITSNVGVRHKLARLAMRIQAGRLLCYRNAYVLSTNRIPNVEAAMAKCYNSELLQQVATVGLEIFGPESLLAKNAVEYADGMDLWTRWQSSIADTFAAGPSEIMRTVIAVRGLGLPRAS